MYSTIEKRILGREQFFPQVQRSHPKLHSPTIERVLPLLIAVDALTWTIAFCGGVYLFPHYAGSNYFVLIIPVVEAAALYPVGGYDRRTDFHSLEYTSEHLIATTIAIIVSLLLVCGVSTFHVAVNPSRVFVSTSLLFFSLVSIAFRRAIHSHVRHSQASSSILVLGAGAEAQSFFSEYMTSGLPWKLQFIDPSGKMAGTHILSPRSPIVQTGSIDNLALSCANYAAVLLACNTSELPAPLLQRLVALHSSSVPVMTLEAFYEKHWRRVSAKAVGSGWVFDSEFRLARGSSYSYIKRIFDIVLSASALILLSPALLLISLIIRCESRGPAIFPQERVGRDGRIFVMLKFRTMHKNTGDIYTRVGDKRVTKFGHWLRLTRLDELPQLWNVLVGEMSLIGPRAEWVKCAEIYEKSIPNYHLRHLVIPGITGWAQVRFTYGEGINDAVEKFEFDLYYIRHFSLPLDVSIVLKTIHVMLFGKGR